MTGIPSRPASPVIGDQGALRANAVLAMPAEPTRTAEQREAAERAGRQQKRSAAVQVADRALREGCQGAGCADPAHGEHVAGVMEGLRALGLTEDPESRERRHFGKPAARRDVA